MVLYEKGEIDWDINEGKVFLSTSGHELHSFSSSFTPDDRYRLQIERFIECVCREKSPHCSLSDGLKVLKIINQARQGGELKKYG